MFLVEKHHCCAILDSDMKEHYLKAELYALIASDTQIFEFIQTGALDGIWYWDLQNPEQEWMSPKFWETLGYDPDKKEHASREWQNIIFEEDLQIASVNLEKHCQDSSYPYDQIVRYKHKDGSTVWIRCRGMAIRDKEGKALRMLGAHTDLTKLKIAEQEIAKLASEFETVFNGTQDAMFLMKVLEDGTFQFIRNNHAHQKKSGIALADIQNKTPQELLGKKMGDVVAQNYHRCVEERSAITYEEELALPEGKRYWRTTLSPIFEQDRVQYIVGSATDLTDLKFLEQNLYRYAHYDLLTGLPNRRFFFTQFEQWLNKKQPFSLLYIDLDGFKAVNDTYGHASGDKVLNHAGSCLKTLIKEPDFAARLGGDEFAVLLHSDTDSQKTATAILKALHTSIDLGPVQYIINASIGIAIYPEQGQDSKVLLHRADKAMYKMKNEQKRTRN